MVQLRDGWFVKETSELDGRKKTVAIRRVTHADSEGFEVCLNWRLLIVRGAPTIPGTSKPSAVSQAETPPANQAASAAPQDAKGPPKKDAAKAASVQPKPAAKSSSTQPQAGQGKPKAKPVPATGGPNGSVPGSRKEMGPAPQSRSGCRASCKCSPGQPHGYHHHRWRSHNWGARHCMWDILTPGSCPYGARCWFAYSHSINSKSKSKKRREQRARQRARNAASDSSGSPRKSAQMKADHTEAPTGRPRKRPRPTM